MNERMNDTLPELNYGVLHKGEITSRVVIRQLKILELGKPLFIQDTVILH